MIKVTINWKAPSGIEYGLDYDVEVDVDPSYGEDIDGNRGVPRIITCPHQVFDDEIFYGDDAEAFYKEQEKVEEWAACSAKDKAWGEEE